MTDAHLFAYPLPNNLDGPLISKTTTEDHSSRLVEDDTIDPQDDDKDLDDDELFEELENDDYGMANFREQRIEELKDE